MKTINIQVKDFCYTIDIKKGILKDIGSVIKDVYKENKIIIVTDNNVNELYGDIVKKSLEKNNFNVKLIEIPAGEESKSLDMAQYLYSEFLSFKLSRSDLVMSLGGGIVGDLTGFVSSTYLRGISYIQIPTSLLAQIDSSIGGKVAVNLEEGKNLVGSFYHPQKVIIDPEVLKTLPNRFFKDGLGEIIKYGCIKDKELFNILLQYKSKKELMNNIEFIIYDCCSIKKNVVQKDEKDLGIRMILNFGHTLGHALEKYYDYKKYTHGEAVSIGMYYITKKSEDLGYTKKGTSESLRRILEKYKINYKLPKINMDYILECVLIDKKNISQFINLVLLKEIGEGFVKKVKKQDVKKIFN